MIVDDVLNGSRRALARLLTAVENEQAAAEIAALYPHTGRASIIGVTGAPGTGKSTLVSALAHHYRALSRTVAILAVDPSSPYTGGALLGDRIRMRDLAGDDGVFIRSMAARGTHGGLARTSRDAVRVLDAAGFDVILVETVGAGQGEVEIARMAHTTLVVEAPGLGDDVQALKAGILEIADVLVVNKADRPGAEQTINALRAMLNLGHPSRDSLARAHHRTLADDETSHTPADDAMWVPPIVATAAADGLGIDDLAAAIDAHARHLNAAGRRAAHERDQIERELLERLREHALARLLHRLPPGALSQGIERVQARAADPESTALHLLAHLPW